MSIGEALVVSGGITASSYNTPSDERLKTDIHDFDDREMRAALDRLDSVRSVEFRYKNEARPQPHVGVIAQSVPAQLLAPNTGEGPLAISLSDTLGYTIAAVRGLHSETRELEAKVAERDERIRKLEERLSSLETKLEGLAQP